MKASNEKQKPRELTDSPGFNFAPLAKPKPLKGDIAFNDYMAYGGGPRSLETVKKEDLVRVCPDCKSKDIDYANEEFYCKKCGLVLD